MKLTKEQRAARSKSIQLATITSLREHFTGQGAATRRLQFLRDASLASAVWFARLLFIGSWAVIAGLLVGPEHDFFLKQVHAWMVATPVDQVLVRSHAMFLSVAWEFGKMSLLLGVGQKLLAVVRPATEQAKQRFEAMEHAA
jgi:hypothetical protein